MLLNDLVITHVPRAASVCISSAFLVTEGLERSELAVQLFYIECKQVALHTRGIKGCFSLKILILNIYIFNFSNMLKKRHFAALLLIGENFFFFFNKTEMYILYSYMPKDIGHQYIN